MEAVSGTQLPSTEGGYKYIKTTDGLIIRSSIKNERLVEDGETYEEYKMRKMVSSKLLKRKKRLIWDSSSWGTLTAERSFEIYQEMLRRANLMTKESESKEEIKEETKEDK
jgi:N-acetylmuramic acid 6-phosphate (MurNAc-6-P) etherase